MQNKIEDNPQRYDANDIEQWRETGFVVIEDFFDAHEIVPIVEDFGVLYADRGPEPTQQTEKNVKASGEIGAIHGRQFMNFDQMPYAASPAVNLISLHQG